MVIRDMLYRATTLSACLRLLGRMTDVPERDKDADQRQDDADVGHGVLLEG